MANPDAPFGLRPVRYRYGTPYQGACRMYYVPSTDATALYIGDPVTKTGTSNTTEFMGFPPGTLPAAVRTVNGDAKPITGVVVGVVPVTHESTTYRPASTERIIMVADDPNLVFHIRDDGAAALAATSVGLNAVLISTGGSAYTGISAVELDTASDAPAVDDSNQLTILGLANIPGNELGAHAVWEVAICVHTEASGAAGL